MSLVPFIQQLKTLCRGYPGNIAEVVAPRGSHAQQDVFEMAQHARDTRIIKTATIISNKQLETLMRHSRKGERVIRDLNSFNVFNHEAVLLLQQRSIQRI